LTFFSDLFIFFAQGWTQGLLKQLLPGDPVPVPLEEVDNDLLLVLAVALRVLTLHCRKPV
jgi:hypothetical protein